MPLQVNYSNSYILHPKHPDVPPFPDAQALYMVDLYREGKYPQHGDELRVHTAIANEPLSHDNGKMRAGAVPGTRSFHRAVLAGETDQEFGVSLGALWLGPHAPSRIVAQGPVVTPDSPDEAYLTILNRTLQRPRRHANTEFALLGAYAATRFCEMLSDRRQSPWARLCLVGLRSAVKFNLFKVPPYEEERICAYQGVNLEPRYRAPVIFER